MAGRVISCTPRAIGDEVKVRAEDMVERAARVLADERRDLVNILLDLRNKTCVKSKKLYTRSNVHPCPVQCHYRLISITDSRI